MQSLDTVIYMQSLDAPYCRCGTESLDVNDDDT